MRNWCAVLAFLLLPTPAFAEAADTMEAFPPAEPGMVRYVLQLPEQADESAFKVELIVGRTIQVDEANRYFFGGKIEEVTIEGWGFPRYVVSKLGPLAATLRAVDPNAPKVSRFVVLGGESYLVRYSSRLPIVVYAPEGVEARFRIWNAEPQHKAIDIR